ncbi:tetratricopeptide repeat protein [Blastopirellula marina]|nr:CDC27 family protein [Blastopirellula marina]
MSDEPVTYELALLHYCQGSYAEAGQVLEQHLQQEPENPSAWELKGILCHALCDFEVGRDALERAESFQPLSVSGKLALADCYAHLGMTALSEAVYYHLAQLPIADPEILARLARGLAMLGQYVLAADVCQRAVRLDPNSHNARYGVAFYLAKAGHPAEFIQPILINVIALAPEVFFYRVALVTILCRLNQPQRAYLAIADATDEELKSLQCRCCIRRLVQIFSDAGDQRRAAICRQRLQEKPCCRDSKK